MKVINISYFIYDFILGLALNLQSQGIELLDFVVNYFWVQTI